MKTLILIISTLVLISWVSSSSSKENTKDPSFSYKELESAEKVPIPSLQYIEASDKTRLAYREYTPKQISAVLIFYHGGGTYSAGGYQYIKTIAQSISNILITAGAIGAPAMIKNQDSCNLFWCIFSIGKLCFIAGFYILQ